MIITACGLVALIIIGVAVYSIWNRTRRPTRSRPSLTDIGASAKAAGCTEVEEQDATGAGEHTTDKVTYDTTPPSFGAHNPTPDSGGKHIYTDDRPDAEVLVHNLEHGWTIVWYDQSVADDPEQMKTLEATARSSTPRAAIRRRTSSSRRGPRTTKAVERSPTASTSRSRTGRSTSPRSMLRSSRRLRATSRPSASSQYCSDFSGAALDDFMKKYPYDDAPEGSSGTGSDLNVTLDAGFGPATCEHRECAHPEAERVFTPATIITFVRTVATVVVGLLGAVHQSLPLLLTALVIYWVGDSIDGIVARIWNHETRMGATLDIMCDRLSAAVFYIGYAWYEPSMILPVGIYLAEFMVIDMFLSLAFLAWPISSPNYFYLIDRRLYMWNWSRIGKRPTLACSRCSWSSPSSRSSPVSSRQGLFTLKAVSLGWLMKLGLPVPTACLEPGPGRTRPAV